MMLQEALAAVVTLILGFLLVMFGLIVLALSRVKSNGEARGAGVVVIGPVPIIISGRGAWTLVLLLTIFAASLVLLLYVSSVGWSGGG
jgi:uncharacterized protein (TIGR00304 family)